MSYKTVPVNTVIVAPPTRQSLQYPRITPVRAKLSHQWWLEQTELEWREESFFWALSWKLLCSNYTSCYIPGCSFFLWTCNDHPESTVFPPDVYSTSDALIPPSQNSSLSSKPATQEKPPQVWFSPSLSGAQLMLAERYQRKRWPWSFRDQGALLFVVWCWNTKASLGVRTSSWIISWSYSWAPPVSHNIIPYCSSDTKAQIHLLIIIQQSLS